MLRLTYGVLLLSTLAATGCGDQTGGSAGSGGTPMMFEPGPICTAFCATIIGECGVFAFDEASCRQGCEEDLSDERAVSDACVAAVEGVFECVTELECDGVYSWRDAPLTGATDYPCRDAVLAVDAVRELEPACGQAE